MNISLDGIDFAAADGCMLEQIAYPGGIAVRVKGGDNAVTLRLDKALARAGGSAVTSFSLGIRHLDAGPHSFHVSFGLASFIIGCDGAPLKPKILGKILCDEGPATIIPAFEGAATYSVSVERAGVKAKPLQGRTGAFTIPDFDRRHDGHEETLEIAFTYGKVRKDAWSMTLHHEAYTVTFTAEAAQRLSRDPPVFHLRTGGLDGVVLTNPSLKTGAAP